jgi:hypothetical protein
VVVYTLGISTIGFAARLPIAFENVPGIRRERSKDLRLKGPGGYDHQEHRYA